jgi:hypothetical protein
MYSKTGIYCLHIKLKFESTTFCKNAIVSELGASDSVRLFGRTLIDLRCTRSGSFTKTPSCLESLDACVRNDSVKVFQSAGSLCNDPRKMMPARDARSSESNLDRLSLTTQPAIP